ncbi:MAG: transketolase [Actinobacteria bacterium]|nr:transketolase [Actinomycetota bacterium]
MSTTTEPEALRTDVVARCHGDAGHIPAGIECDAVNAVRFLAADAVERAGSGHPGTPMALAPLGYRLYTRYLRHDPKDPHWPDRDRFILSAGQASMLLYSCLHLAGYDLSIDDLQRFRQLGSKTPGHPERGHTPGVEVTTGPLGQGVSMAVGAAITERMLAARFNRDDLDPLIEHRTWAIASDGDLMEGVSGETASLAGALGVDRLTVVYDDNHISIEGSTDLAFCEHVQRRYSAYGWHVVRVDDGNDLAALDGAVEAARQETDRPTLVIVRTHIGYGSPKQDSADAHGSPLGQEALAATREQLDWSHGPFTVPDDVYDHWRTLVSDRAIAHGRWEQTLERYREVDPAAVERFERQIAGDLPEGWSDELPGFEAGDGIATRKALGQVLNAVAPDVPELVGGSADLAPSTYTTIEGAGDVAAGQWDGRNFHFGVREHAMGAVLNGMAAHGGFRVFGATFLVFSDYVRPAIRLSALMNLPVTYVFTHDSIGLGQDGPTHQPIEHLAALRAIPNLTVLRPADSNETADALVTAIASDGPVALVLSRQSLPVLDPYERDPAGAVVADGEDATVVTTGSEVDLALAARDQLAEQGTAVRVVSLPSWELYRARPAAEKRALLPPERPAVAVEAGSAQGWREFTDRVVGIDRFGVSAPAPEVYQHLDLTPERVTEQIHELLDDRVQRPRA